MDGNPDGLSLDAPAHRVYVLSHSAPNITAINTADGSVLGTVNLDAAVEERGGHVVQGHVDGVGTVEDVGDDGFARRVSITAPAGVLRYVVEKGSIAVDGVSLTVAEIDDRSFTVSLIPETLERTNLGSAERGTTVNLEVDVLAKYVEKLLP